MTIIKLQEVPNSHTLQQEKEIKPQMIAVLNTDEINITKDQLLEAAKQGVCGGCVFSRTQRNPGPCGGLSHAAEAQSRISRVITLTAVHGIKAKTKEFADWAGKFGKGARKLCATSKRINI